MFVFVCVFVCFCLCVRARVGAEVKKKFRVARVRMGIDRTHTSRAAHCSLGCLHTSGADICADANHAERVQDQGRLAKKYTRSHVGAHTHKNTHTCTHTHFRQPRGGECVLCGAYAGRGAARGERAGGLRQGGATDGKGLLRHRAARLEVGTTVCVCLSEDRCVRACVCSGMLLVGVVYTNARAHTHPRTRAHTITHTNSHIWRCSTRRP